MRKTGIICAVLMGSAILSPAFTAGTDEAGIPFRMLGHLMTVKVRIDASSRDFNFVVDTGGATFVAKEVADVLGLKQMGPQAKISTLHLEGMDIENIFCFTTFDFSHLNSLGIPIHGIIGSTLMERYRATFDFERRRITFSDGSETLEKPEGAALLKFTNHRINNAPLVEFEIDGKTYKGMIDTGQPHSVVLPIETFEDYERGEFSGIIESRGLMEKWPNPKILHNTMVRLRTMRLGPWAFSDLLCLFGDLPQMLSMPLIGMDFLSLFTIIIDFPRDEMVLIPRDGLSTKTNLFSVGLNVGLGEGGAVVVEGLWKGSPADKAGLEVGDRIVSFEGSPIEPEQLRALQEALRDDGIKAIELEILNEETTRRVVLEKANLF
jgi:predicted aspartyl protease